MSITNRDKELIISKLEEAYKLSKTHDITLSHEVAQLIEAFSSKIDEATSAFTNIVTCIVAKACDAHVDPRYHRQPVKGMPENPTGADNFFSGRSVSEKIIYPWLEEKSYRTAKSGWQTRTFERPQPYTLSYAENIGAIKNEFLSILDHVAIGNVDPINTLAYFFVLEEQAKNQRIEIIKNVAKGKKIGDLTILDIIGLFAEHFNEPDSARLPTLAIYAAYTLLIEDIKSYENLKLLPLAAHEAADLRTESIGDIELSDSEGDIAEALEIKHRIVIDNVIILKAREKILRSKVKRYYILTTHPKCSDIDKSSIEKINVIYREHGCQVIINGVLPTIKYYLRLVSSPKDIIQAYSKLLTTDRAVKTHHIIKWEELLVAAEIVDEPNDIIPE